MKAPYQSSLAIATPGTCLLQIEQRAIRKLASVQTENLARKIERKRRFRGDNEANNGDNRRKSDVGQNSVTGRYKSLLLAVGVISFVVLSPAPSYAQWWSARAPADFEECSENAEKTATSKEAKTVLLSECHSKFAGRRKPGGGYSYFDFMQNRHFDIAGANPTPEEQKYIDEQYTAYLDHQRRSIIAAAFTEKQRQLQQATPQDEKRAMPREVPRKPRVTVNTAPARVRSGSCASNSFSCNWPRLAEGIKDLKKLLGSTPDKTKRGRHSTEIAASNP